MRHTRGRGQSSKWMPTAEMLDELAEHGLRPPVLVDDAGYGDNSQFRPRSTGGTSPPACSSEARPWLTPARRSPSRGNGPAGGVLPRVVDPARSWPRLRSAVGHGTARKSWKPGPIGHASKKSNRNPCSWTGARGSFVVNHNK
ncbi:transposase [Amycolatopsis sp. cmx-4-68]|uniref:transposase n=1 Tax=Amycolatopsis sp. cmx-4-68 TaxID=2790938 RepID=UPI00397A6B9D